MAPNALAQAMSAVSGYLDRLDPDRMSTEQAADAYRAFCELKRLCGAGELLLASRAAESAVWREEGHRSAAEWMAHTSGTAVGEAISSLETATRLEWLPDTADALRRGELSSPQVKAVAAAASHRPGAEKGLLETAATSGLKGLKERCREVLSEAASAEEENARYLAMRARRSFRHWTDVDGAFRGELTLTPDDGARLLSAVQARADERFDEARRRGEEEPPPPTGPTPFWTSSPGRRARSRRRGAGSRLRSSSTRPPSTGASPGRTRRARSGGWAGSRSPPWPAFSPTRS